MIPPKHPQQKGDGSDTFGRRLSRHLSVPNLGIPGGDRKVVRSDEETSRDHGLPETTPLLGDPGLPYGGQDSPTNLDKKWEVAVLEGKIQTTWQRESKVLVRYSAPLILTFLLQYSLTVASVFTVGHLGKVELGAVSLASMTANITGYAVYQGLATSLDTLCAQAYGSGRKKLVGLQTQRMVYFLWAITIPIGIIWLCADLILMVIVPEKDVAILAGQYLKIVLIGAPGYAIFESAKRYMQAQGLFSASLYVLLICAPLNAFLNWLFVWVGFILSITCLTPEKYRTLQWLNCRQCLTSFASLAISMGLQRCAYRCSHYRQPSPYSPRSVCTFSKVFCPPGARQNHSPDI